MAGELDVEAMLRRHTAKWFRGWEMYYELEPFGELRADYRAASIVQMLYNINRGKGQKALPLKDFVLKFEEEPKRKQSWQEQAAMLRLLAAAYSTETSVPQVIEDNPVPQRPQETYPSLDAVGTNGGKVTTEVLKSVKD